VWNVYLVWTKPIASRRRTAGSKKKRERFRLEGIINNPVNSVPVALPGS
jgi:hypothetical protein